MDNDDEDEEMNEGMDGSNASNPPNKILYVSNLTLNLTVEYLSQVFGQYEGFKEVRVVAGKSDIAFVEYETQNQSKIAKARLDGFLYDESKKSKFVIQFAKI